MWKEIKYCPAPIGTIISTKIDDGNGSRNEQRLKFDGKLWWLADGTMYVYYTPTHWDYISHWDY